MMKVNLTKLLDIPMRVKQLAEIPLTALYIEQVENSTGSKGPYSFEMEDKTNGK